MSARPANPELRDKIVRAAAHIIEGCGPDCVTMRQVAEEIGYSSTTIYLYFKDKNAILREAVLRAFDEMNDSCDLAAVGPGALDKYRQRCRAYLMWALMHPGHYTLMFQLPWDVDWSVEWKAEDADRLMRGRLADLSVLAEAVAAGEIPADADLGAIEDAVWASLHGTASLAISRRLTAANPAARPDEIVAAATRVSDVLVNALLKAPVAS